MSLLCFAITLTWIEFDNFWQKCYWERVRNQKMLYCQPHLTSASALPGERGNPGTAVFHCKLFAGKHQKHIWNISPGRSRTILNCPNDRLYAPDGTYSICHPHVQSLPSLSRCQSLCENESCFSSGLEWKPINSVTGISYYLKQCQMQ